MGRASTIEVPAALSWSAGSEGEVLEFASEELAVRVMGPACSFTWESSVHDRVNLADEDLFLAVRETESERTMIEERVSRLSGKTLRFASGCSYHALLLRKEKASFSCRTSLSRLPRLLVHELEPGLTFLSWSGVDWEAIRREIEAVHRVEWEGGIEVALHIHRWAAEGILGEEEVTFLGFREEAELRGSLRHVEMDVVSREDGRRLKQVFSLHFNARKTLGVLDKLEFRTPFVQPRLSLRREVLEPDVMRLRADWNLERRHWAEVEEKWLGPAALDWAGVETVLRLESGPDPSRVAGTPAETECVDVPVDGDHWTSLEMRPGRCYRATLLLRDKQSLNFVGNPLLASPSVWIPWEETSLAVVAMGSSRLLVTWSLSELPPRESSKRDSGASDPLVESSKAAGRTLRYFLQVESRPGVEDFGGAFAATAEVEVEPYVVDSVEVEVSPARVHRVRLVQTEPKGTPEALGVGAATIRTGPTGSTFGTSFRPRRWSLEHPTRRRLRSPNETSDRSLGRLVLHVHAHAPFWPLGSTTSTNRVLGSPGFPHPQLYAQWMESLVPIVSLCRELDREGVDFKLSFDVSPTLVAMLRSVRYQEEFLAFVEARVALAQVELDRAARHDPMSLPVLELQARRLRSTLSLLHAEGPDLTRLLRELQEQGTVELLTAPATHSFLPHFARNPAAVRAQVAAAVQDHEAVFGRIPLGMWLPEGGGFPGIEEIAADEGLRFLVGGQALAPVESELAGERVHGVALPEAEVVYVSPGVDSFCRFFDREAGCPSDSRYLAPRLDRGPFRETSRGGDGEETVSGYDPELALEAAASHADHFLGQCEGFFRRHHETTGRQALSLVPLSLPTLGHEWFEGIQFLEFLAKKLHFDQAVTEITTVSDGLSRDHTDREGAIEFQSPFRGEGSVEEGLPITPVAWTFGPLDRALSEMIRMASDGKRHADLSPLESRLLAQATRELLLAQGSDFPISLSSGDQGGRMRALFLHQLGNFWLLSSMYWGLSEGQPADELLLCELESRQTVLPYVDPLLFASESAPDKSSNL